MAIGFIHKANNSNVSISSPRVEMKENSTHTKAPRSSVVFLFCILLLFLFLTSNKQSNKTNTMNKWDVPFAN